MNDTIQIKKSDLEQLKQMLETTISERNTAYTDIYNLGNIAKLFMSFFLVNGEFSITQIPGIIKNVKSHKDDLSNMGETLNEIFSRYDKIFSPQFEPTEETKTSELTSHEETNENTKK
jgi:hypothetical protein